MNGELNHEKLPEILPGQMAFFPEEETHAAPQRNGEPVLARPIPPPALEQIDSWQYCILIGDVLRRFDGALPEDWLYEVIVNGGNMSYFLYEDALGAMLETGSAERHLKDGTAEIALTATGLDSVRRLRHYVPKVFRDKVHLAALRYVTRQKALRDLQLTYEPDDTGCRLCMHCTDNGQEMFFLRIHAPSRDAAELLGERILRNPAGFFGKIVDLAMQNEEIPFDLTNN